MLWSKTFSACQTSTSQTLVRSNLAVLHRVKRAQTSCTSWERGPTSWRKWVCLANCTQLLLPSTCKLLSLIWWRPLPGARVLAALEVVGRWELHLAVWLAFSPLPLNFIVIFLSLKNFKSLCCSLQHPQELLGSALFVLKVSKPKISDFRRLGEWLSLKFTCETLNLSWCSWREEWLLTMSGYTAVFQRPPPASVGVGADWGGRRWLNIWMAVAFGCESSMPIAGQLLLQTIGGGT